MTTPKDEAHDQLRAWARGRYPVEAATELLIGAFDGRFAESGWPWIHPTVNGRWIDFTTIGVQIGGLPRGEQQLLRIAASLGSLDTTVNLGDCLTGLDHTRLPLVLAAVTHATGGHHPHHRVPAGPTCTLSMTTPGVPHPRAAAPGEPGVTTVPWRSL